MIARDGLREIGIATLVAGHGGGACIWAAWTVSPWFWVPALIFLVLWLAIIAFFRDPKRTIPDEAGLLVAPADGKITEISRLEAHEDIEGPAWRIGIFLSIFDVHLNRSPCAGRVLKTAYQRGEYLDARHPESGARNEANTIVIEPATGTGGPIVVRQIAGVIARRIVCKVQSGDVVNRGQRLGLIKFGSRTELIVSAEAGIEPVVALNDRVRAGTTVLMRIQCPQPVSPARSADRERVTETGQGRAHEQTE